MRMRTWRAALLAVGGVLLCSGWLWTQNLVVIPATEAIGPPPNVSGTGLNGAWYFDPNNPMRLIPDLNAAQIYIASEQPLAQFNFTFGLWDGGRRTAAGLTGDATPVDAFLSSHYQNDAKTLNPPRSDPLQSSIFDMKGYIKITDADLDVTFALGSDDGSLLLIGQTPVEVVRNDGTHGFQIVETEAIFESAGLYPIELIYFNQDFTNNGLPSQGGANFSFESTLGFGGVVNPDRLYPAPPP